MDTNGAIKISVAAFGQSLLSACYRLCFLLAENLRLVSDCFETVVYRKAWLDVDVRRDMSVWLVVEAIDLQTMKTRRFAPFSTSITKKVDTSLGL